MYKHYDYLVVGTGLFGSVFSHEAKSGAGSVWLLIKENMYQEIFIPEKCGAFMYMNMAPIFFILPTVKYGII